MKCKLLACIMVVGLSAVMLTSCSKKEFQTATAISTVSREGGSGTRSAFSDLFQLIEKKDNGHKTDLTTEEAIIVNKTGVMMVNVAGDQYAIGYISLGSLNDSVKALEIDGVMPSVDNIKDGSYTIARPFYIAAKEGLSTQGKDFVNFILSEEGQKIVEESHYIPFVEDPKPYKPQDVKGELVIAGSSSVTPVMEKLKEAYEELNKDVTLEVQQNDSTTGLQSCITGICDIAMSSRELTDNELKELTPVKIALDGIAIIVNKGNPIMGLTKDQVREIFTGEVTTWQETN